MWRILVAEDEESLCLAIVAYLESQEIQPLPAATVQEAMRSLAEGGIDLVVLDLKLANDQALLRHIRETPGLAKLPILALSTWEMDPASHDYLKPGDYLMKPFDMRTLNLMVRRLLGTSQNRVLGIAQQPSCKAGPRS